MWTPDLTVFSGPTYKAIADAIGQAIKAGELKSGERLPTHRALADCLGVTVGTITRGYAEAERQYLVEARVGSGTYVRNHPSENSGFLIADEESQNDSQIDLSYSVALSLNQEQDLSDELEEIRRDRVLMHRLLQYHPEYGMARHRHAGKRWLEMTGIECVDENRILVSNGGQHGFFTTLLALCQRGDTVLCDGLSYPGFIAAARQLGLRLIGLNMDAEGSTPEALELACQRYQPRAIYLMPRLNNPTSRQMSAERIDTLASICRRHQVHIIEDDVQGCLTDSQHATFTNRAPDITILVSSCSKALAGGLRIGFIYPTADTFERVANSLRVSCWMIAPLPAEVACRWIMSERAERMMALQRDELHIRHQMAAETFADYEYEAVSSAFNLWLHLPEPWRAAAFARRAAEADVLLKPAEVFAAGQFPAPQAVRLCLGGETTRTQLQEGLQRIACILKEMPAADGDFD